MPTGNVMEDEVVVRMSANRNSFQTRITEKTAVAANPGAAKPTGIAKLEMFPNDRMDPLFQATVQATEEAIVNALVAAETMTGIDDHKVEAIPHDKLREVLRKYSRLGPPGEARR